MKRGYEVLKRMASDDKEIQAFIQKARGVANAR